jgi:hypothetical protein
MDPLTAQPAEMPCHEFDGVDYTCNQPGEAPPQAVQAYFDSGLRPAQLADRLDDLVSGMAATLAAVAPRPMSPRGQWMRRGQQKAHGAPWTPQTRDTIAADLRADHLDVFHLIFIGDQDPRRQWLLDAWTHPQPADAPDAAITMSLYGTDMWPADESDQAADEVLALLRGWVRPLRLRTAAVTHDRGGSNLSPWEKWYATGRHVTATQTHERVRGYYWANLLTTGHLARLGGLEQLRAHATEHGLIVEPADPQQADDAVILRAPGPVTTFDDDQLAAVKHALRSTLMHLQYAMYLGYPLRIIPDPGTAFRKVPPGSPFPRLLDGRGPYADEVP